MGALNIILSTQLVIIIFLSSSVLLSSCTTLPDPPPPSPQIEIFNTVIRGIIKRLASIAKDGEPYILDESTVEKLNQNVPGNRFVQSLLQEVKGGNAMKENDFIAFLSRNEGFLKKALEICLKYRAYIQGFDGPTLETMFSLSEVDGRDVRDFESFITPEKMAKRLYEFAQVTERKNAGDPGNPEKSRRRGK